MPSPALLAHRLDLRAQPEAPPPGRIGLRDRPRPVDQHAPGRKVRPPDKVHQRAVLGQRVLDQMDRRLDQLGDIVRRDRGRHPHRDPARSVGEQVGEQPRHDLGLFVLAIIGRLEVDRPLVEPGHQRLRDPRQPRFGVAIGGGIIPVDVAEIALPVDQRIAQREILREPHHRVIDRLVAVRMILADDIAHHPRTFLVRRRRIELEQPHRPQQPPVNRLQAIAHIGQRPRGDRRQRIDEIAFGQRGIERDFDFLVGGGLHRRRLARPPHHPTSLKNIPQLAQPVLRYAAWLRFGRVPLHGAIF